MEGCYGNLWSTSKWVGTLAEKTSHSLGKKIYKYNCLGSKLFIQPDTSQNDKNWFLSGKAKHRPLFSPDYLTGFFNSDWYPISHKASPSTGRTQYAEDSSAVHNTRDLPSSFPVSLPLSPSCKYFHQVPKTRHVNPFRENRRKKPHSFFCCFQNHLASFFILRKAQNLRYAQSGTYVSEEG